jgi:hypothetical protein
MTMVTDGELYSAKGLMAGLKARLARERIDLSPHATVRAYSPPPKGARIKVVAVDVVKGNPHPDYAVRGFATCINCGGLCYVDDETHVLITSAPEIYPSCMDCLRKAHEAGKAWGPGEE